MTKIIHVVGAVIYNEKEIFSVHVVRRICPCLDIGNFPVAK